MGDGGGGDGGGGGDALSGGVIATIVIVSIVGVAIQACACWVYLFGLGGRRARDSDTDVATPRHP